MKINNLHTDELEILSTINDKLEYQVIDDTTYEEVKNELVRRSNELEQYIGKAFRRNLSDGFDILFFTGKKTLYPHLIYNEIFFKNDEIKIEYSENNILYDVSYLYEYIEISKEDYDLILNKIKTLSNELTNFI